MMDKEKQYLLWFEQMERKDVAIVGGKSSSLGEMTAKTDVPVPYGFATTAYAYRYFIEQTGLKQKMADLIGQLTDVENTALLRDISAKLRQAIMEEEMPQDLQDAITKAYAELGAKMGEKDPYVAVRSPATAEDLPDASFAGHVPECPWGRYGYPQSQGMLRFLLHGPCRLLPRKAGL